MILWQWTLRFSLVLNDSFIVIVLFKPFFLVQWMSSCRWRWTTIFFYLWFFTEQTQTCCIKSFIFWLTSFIRGQSSAAERFLLQFVSKTESEPISAGRLLWDNPAHWAVTFVCSCHFWNCWRWRLQKMSRDTRLLMQLCAEVNVLCAGNIMD